MLRKFSFWGFIMNDSQKLDLILQRLEKQDVVSEERRLQELAFKHWGLVDRECQLLFLTKSILDSGKANNVGKSISFLIHLGSAVNEYGADELIKALDHYKKDSI